jgi:hypothetical protein
MPIDGLGEEGPPRKWLDKKQFVRVDPATGLPQLVRVEPVVAANGELDPDSVHVYIDDRAARMERKAAELYVASLNCTPLEIAANWKHKKVH